MMKELIIMGITLILFGIIIVAGTASIFVMASQWGAWQGWLCSGAALIILSAGIFYGYKTMRLPRE